MYFKNYILKHIITQTGYIVSGTLKMKTFGYSAKIRSLLKFPLTQYI